VSSIITPADIKVLAPNISDGEAAAMIEDATAQASLVAPCLGDEAALTSSQRNQYKSLLRSTIVRWHEAGVGGIVSASQTIGPMSQSETYDSSSRRKGLFWPSEIELLQMICRQSRRAGTVDTTPNIHHTRNPHHAC
jgi:hypothetical protein